MQAGICVPAEKVTEVLGAKPEFIEEHIQNFLKPAEPEEAFAQNLARAKALAVPVRAANCFLPGTMKCVGPEVDQEALARYAQTAFRRAQAAGIEVLVFGSGGARKIPDGFPREQAKRQFGIRRVRMTTVEIKMAAGDAVVVVEAVVHVAGSPLGRDRWPTRWRLWWVRREAGWRVSGASLEHPASVPGAPAGP